MLNIFIGNARIYLQDVLQRMEWLQTELEDSEHTPEALEDFEDELQELQDLIDEVPGVPTDTVLIQEGEAMADLAYEMAQDQYGDIVDEWPMSLVNWNEAAGAMLSDFTPVEWGGFTYYYYEH